MMQRRFEELAQYHASHHLPHCIPEINSGEATPDGKEFRLHDGILILENGPKTIKDLVREKLVSSEMIASEAQRVSDRDELYGYLERFGSEDGVHVLDTSNGLMYWVYSVDNKLATKAAAPYLPSHFLGSIPLQEGKLGNKTRLAVHLPREMVNLGTHLEAYLIRQTPVNGVGTLSHFTEQGLVERLYRSPGIVGDGSPSADHSQALWTYERYGQNGHGPQLLEQQDWSASNRRRLLELSTTERYDHQKREVA